MPAQPTHPSTSRGTRLTIFALLFLCYAWFHAGGGWNQNVRFAQVRAMAEQATFAIDDQLLFDLEVSDAGTSRYRRIALSDPSDRSARLPRAVSLDLSQHGGHFYPNKPPGLSLLAVPGYLVARPLAAVLGSGPGDGWTLTLALYLTSVLSVGLLAALGGVVFHDVARRLFPEAPPRAVMAATLAYGLGTPVFAYATFLIDHAVVATLALVAFRSLLIAREGDGVERGGALIAAGFFTGVAVCVNHSAALLALLFGVYALAVHPERAHVRAYLVGGIPPALALLAYQWICFGNPLHLPQDHPLAMFQSEAPFLGSFGLPGFELVPQLLLMPYRGLFFWSPVLLLGLLALVALARQPGRRPEALLFAAILLAFLWMNASFNAWHGGGTFGPRYLVPAVPFLALPLVTAFQRFFRASLVVATASVALALLVTAVSPQLDAGLHRPLRQFYAPLASGGTTSSGDWELRGPVSVHPVGWVGAGLESHSAESEVGRWSSFNLGELFFPGSWLSLGPLAVGLSVVAGLGVRRTQPRRKSA